MASTLGTPAALELGLLLQRFRKRAGLTLQQLAAQTDSHHSELSRIEQAKRRLDDVLLGSILGALGITGDEREEAVALFQAASDPNQIAVGKNRQVAVVRSYEDAADDITTWQPGFVPGPLQTRRYAEAILRQFAKRPQDAVEGVDVRMARAAKILSGGLVYTAVISELALRYPPCEKPVMVEQLNHLSKIAHMPHLTVRVMPLNTTLTETRYGPFVLIESSRAGTAVVHLEQVAGSTTMTDAKNVRGYKLAAEVLRGAAMGPEESRELIEEIAKGMERTV